MAMCTGLASVCGFLRTRSGRARRCMFEANRGYSLFPPSLPDLLEDTRIYIEQARRELRRKPHRQYGR